MTSQAYLEGKAVKETKVLISELGRQFYNIGWVSRAGGSISIRVHDDSVPKSQQLIVMSPSGVQMEKMELEDMFVLYLTDSILSSPSPKPYPHKHPKCSARCPTEISHMEMIKGIKGHGYYDELVVPIIENTASEYELTTRLVEAIKAYPKTTAVLVRNGGLYVWGDSWISAKTQRFIVLEIEGTTTPISFVAEVLFPYARDNVGKHLSATYETAETQYDIKLLRSQVQNDQEIGVAGAVPIPSPDAGKEQVIAALVANVEAMIKADRKIHALKQLQGHIWKTGYKNKELKGLVFDDVPEALEKWHALGVKVYIYSSGSRLEQRLIFGNTNYGDLRKYLSGFFETTVGNKRETSSYIEILESLGVDKPSDVLCD